MAERVHTRLEDTAVELRELVELGVFTEAEVSKIAAQRMNHEFAIAKRNASLMDYLRYIAVCARARLVLFFAKFAQHAFREWSEWVGVD
jgi:hypothetical protein